MLYPNPYIYGADQAISPSTASDLTIAAERATKRASLGDGISSPRAAKRSRKVGPTSHSSTASPLMGNPHSALHMHTDPALIGQAPPPASKPRRVRTGCLTCRERHLKCDEAQPICQNCRKSNRQCKRGVRLNFIDTTVRQPPTMTPIHDWNVSFHDESRDIANEYVGGFERYAVLEESSAPYQIDAGLLYPFHSQDVSQQHHGQHVPPLHGLADPFGEEGQQQRDAAQQFRAAQANAAYAMASLNSLPSYGYVEQPITDEKRDFIRDPKELSYMRAFVEDVGVWMDAMDADKQFSQQLPHLALPNPMLYNALLACGARHLSLLTNTPSAHAANLPHSTADTDALQYYNTATSYLLQFLQSADRNVVTCATTATILNVYEVMSEKYKQHINHIKGARALIRECGWSARSEGVGRACFWINVGMEVLSCLEGSGGEEGPARVAWDPDEWGVDLDWSGPQRVDDEVWTMRAMYLVAKVVNFRAAGGGGRGVLADPPVNHAKRLGEWTHLRSILDAWNRFAPRSMHPLGLVDPSPSSSFPEVWIPKRAAVMARLLYHTAFMILAQNHPHREREQEMSELCIENARLIVGIARSNPDKGVANVAIRALAIAAEIVTDADQQREVLAVLRRVAENTAWNVQALLSELPKKWGWPPERSASGGAEQMLRPNQVPPEISATTAVLHQHQQLPKNYPQHNSSPGMRQPQGGTPPQRGSRSRSNTLTTAGAMGEFATAQQQFPVGYPGGGNGNAGVGAARPYYGWMTMEMSHV